MFFFGEAVIGSAACSGLVLGHGTEAGPPWVLLHGLSCCWKALGVAFAACFGALAKNVMFAQTTMEQYAKIMDGRPLTSPNCATSLDGAVFDSTGSPSLQEVSWWYLIGVCFNWAPITASDSILTHLKLCLESLEPTKIATLLHSRIPFLEVSSCYRLRLSSYHRMASCCLHYGLR